MRALASGAARLAEAVADLRRVRRLPRFVTLADGDNELPVDLESPLLVAAFADEVASRDGARLVELFPAPEQLIVRGEDGRYTNETILTFMRASTDDRVGPPATNAPTVRRYFPPGSDWLYAKVYCGASTADRVLREAIGPVVRGALERGDAAHWFFLRYADPAHHVRVRFAGPPRVMV